jgi:hypothetical protein
MEMYHTISSYSEGEKIVAIEFEWVEFNYWENGEVFRGDGEEKYGWRRWRENVHGKR